MAVWVRGLFEISCCDKDESLSQSLINTFQLIPNFFNASCMQASLQPLRQNKFTFSKADNVIIFLFIISSPLKLLFRKWSDDKK